MSDQVEITDYSPWVDRRTWTWGDGDPNKDGTRQLDDYAGTGAWPEDLEITYPADSNMTIPGQGEAAPSCGEVGPNGFCNTAGHLQWGTQRCMRRTCPNCDGMWTGDRARRVCRRLQAYRHTKPKNKERRLLHLSVSPPPGDVTTIVEFDAMIKDAYTLAKEQGVTGGYAVPHGYRVKHDYQMLWNEKWCDEFDGGIWKWIRENDKKDWRDMVYWSPHVHIIGVCPDLAENNPEEQDGWNCVRLGSALEPMRGLAHEDSYESVIRRTRYILSHATFDPNDNRQIARWFGSVYPSGFSPEEELSPGALETIERYTTEVYRGDGEDEDGQTCQHEGCMSDCSHISEAKQALQSKSWCQEIGRDAQRRLTVAFDWFIGDVEPPPGLKSPRNEDDAKAAFQAMLDSYS